jgi:hypothetical protein
MKSDNQIYQVNLAYNGDIVITGKINSQQTEWRITQTQILAMLIFINSIKDNK